MTTGLFLFVVAVLGFVGCVASLYWLEPVEREEERKI